MHIALTMTSDNDDAMYVSSMPLPPWVESRNSDATLLLSWIFPRGGNAGGGGLGGVDHVILRELGVLIRTLVFFWWHDVGGSTLNISPKKYGTPTM